MKKLWIIGMILTGAFSTIGCSDSSKDAQIQAQQQQIAMLQGCIANPTCKTPVTTNAAGQVLVNGAPVAAPPTTIAIAQAVAAKTAAIQGASQKLATNPESANDAVGVVHVRETVTSLNSGSSTASTASATASVGGDSGSSADGTRSTY